MGWFCFLKVLLVSVLLLLYFSEGFSRQLKENVKFQDSTVHVLEAGADSREMIELIDYKYPGPNTNSKSGFMFIPPPQAR